MRRLVERVEMLKVLALLPQAKAAEISRDISAAGLSTTSQAPQLRAPELGREPT